MAEANESVKERLLEAILLHVPFDGWSEKAFRAAASDSDIDLSMARDLFPRGAMDVAVAYHRAADDEMVAQLNSADLNGMKYRDRVATALWLRVKAMDDREAVRRATTLFSLPTNAPEGAKLIWETADHIWVALGDTSKDANWYSKRATLSAVWASVVLYWLGDDSPDHEETRAFIDRRIEDVMQIEKVKARLRDNPVTKPFSKLQENIMGRFRVPDTDHLADLPGHFTNSK